MQAAFVVYALYTNCIFVATNVTEMLLIGFKKTQPVIRNSGATSLVDFNVFEY